MESTLKNAELEAIDRKARDIGRDLFSHLRRHRPHVFQRRWWDDRIMDWAMRDESVKVQMFRFVDVLPMLATSDAVTSHLREYFDEVRRHLPSAVRLAVSVASPGSVAGRALAIAARRNASSHARRFIAGFDIESVLATARRQRRLRRAFTLDVLGEAITSEVEADRYAQSYAALIRGVAAEANVWPEDALIDRDRHGPLPRVNVSVKLSALDCRFDAIDRRGSTARVGERLRHLLRLAREHDAFVNVDMESYAMKDLTLHVFREVLSEEEFRSETNVGIVLQCYLRDSWDDLVALRDWARERGAPVWVRLVKGAYWDYEVIHATAEGWPIPVFQEKWQSDAAFERLALFLMQNAAHLRPALGSHNVRSLAYAIAAAEYVGLDKGDFEIQMLYGMGDPEKQALVDRGHRLRIYMPYGELIPGMAYLVRRLLENTSNDSFLRASFADQTPADVLLANPLTRSGRDTLCFEETLSMDSTKAPGSSDRAGFAAAPQPPPAFRNEPLSDFAVETNRRAMRDALQHVRAQFGATYPLRIGERDVATEAALRSTNPSAKDQTVGLAASAGAEEADAAVAAAHKAFPAWANTSVEKRVDFLRRAAEAMRRRRFELAAWMVYESGKPWREADGDVAEAIDFCEYYAAGAIRLGAPHGVDVAGEENRFEYRPRGVTAVIAPWNFPLAILTGMTAAALATGNTVVMKPAEQSPVIAAKLMEIFREIDLPSGVLNYLPGKGESAGARLVEHPLVALVAFTGSRAVGTAIYAKAAAVSAAGTPMIKRVIAEMGGKNAIIVDDDADLDEAVLGVVRSAFSFQGQKCSAASRCVVLEPVYDTFVQRLVEAARSLRLGPADDPATQVGPVIDQEALDRVRRYIEIARTEGRELLATDVGQLAGKGYYVGPHIYGDVKPSARIAQEEVFGPVLAVMKSGSLNAAIDIVGGTDYALTAGIYSRSPANLDRASEALAAGNVYLNRPITGALVSRQPFGGYRASGIGTKAGGPDYLYEFVLPRTITENTMRRGFAPASQK